MNFGAPWAFLALLPLAFAAWRLLRRSRGGGLAFAAVSRLPSRAAGWRAAVASIAPILLVVALLLLVVASSRPRMPLAHETREVDAIAIVMAMDVSGSMEALDLTPPGVEFSREHTRLKVVKRLFAEFVEKRPNDLIGIVTFGGYAATRSPLTADHRALLKVLEGVDIPGTVFDEAGQPIARDEQMTAIGDGLATAVLRLKNAKPASKVVILLSDGVSNTGAVEPDMAAKAAAQSGVKVYAIGVGTRSRRTPIFARDLFGRERLTYTDMTFDERQLKGLAQATGGMYFAVNDRESLAKALAEIDGLEKTRLEADAWDRWQELFVWPLMGGMLLVLVAISLSMASSRRIC